MKKTGYNINEWNYNREVRKNLSEKEQVQKNIQFNNNFSSLSAEEKLQAFYDLEGHEAKIKFFDDLHSGNKLGLFKSFIHAKKKYWNLFNNLPKDKCDFLVGLLDSRIATKFIKYTAPHYLKIIVREKISEESKSRIIQLLDNPTRDLFANRLGLEGNCYVINALNFEEGVKFVSIWEPEKFNRFSDFINQKSNKEYDYVANVCIAAQPIIEENYARKQSNNTQYVR